jgi:hypothetical protein
MPQGVTFRLIERLLIVYHDARSAALRALGLVASFAPMLAVPSVANAQTANVTVTSRAITGVGNAGPANVTVTASAIKGVGNAAPANVTVTASPITGVGNAAPANVTVTTSTITGVGNVAAPLTGVPRRTP